MIQITKHFRLYYIHTQQLEFEEKSHSTTPLEF